MKLEKYENKKSKKRKTLLISLGVIVLAGISFLLYKTFASFTESIEFPIMNGKVDYFGNSDIYFVFYKDDDQLLEEMPQKDNEENLVFDHGECDNGASIEWNESEWAPLVKGLNKVKTRCSLYFEKQVSVELGGIKVPVAKSGDGLYEVPHDDLEELGQEWNKTEYRYAGVNPNNYVKFNNEIWRIIGLVNVKVGDSVEQRVKIVRIDGVKNQKDFGLYSFSGTIYESKGYQSYWISSKLKDMLNVIYYESGIGECFPGESSWSDSFSSVCDFSSGKDLPKGLDEISRNMIDKEVIWNIGGSSSNNDIKVGMFYERERGIKAYSSYLPEWSKENDSTNHNGIGLVYPSDYGYATSGGSIGRYSCFAKELYNWNEDNYQSECGGTDWLKPSSGYLWTLLHCTYRSDDAFVISGGYATVTDNDDSVMYFALGVWPTLYLTTSTKIVDGTGNINSPFVLSEI